MRDLDSKNSISIKLKSAGSGELYICRDSQNGKVLANCSLSNTNGSYQDVSCALKSQKRECDLYFVFVGDNVDCVIDSFMFK